MGGDEDENKIKIKIKIKMKVIVNILGNSEDGDSGGGHADE